MAANDEKRVVYMNANSTTLMPNEVVKKMIQWVNRGNPSDDHASALEARKLMDSFREHIAKLCGFALADYAVIFTSGASESNNFMVTSAVRSYAHATGTLPHIVTSAVEHKSLLECCRLLETERLAELTVVPVATAGPALGAVRPEDVQKAIRRNTCIVSVMAANNETGVLNDVGEIAAIARAKGVPFHTDAVQAFAKAPLQLAKTPVDAFSVSFHKLHGPPGVGLLVVSRKLIDGYHLCPHICGTQNGGLRGGTEPIHSIAAAFEAVLYTMRDRRRKNERLAKLRAAIRAIVAKSLPAFDLDDYESGSAAAVWEKGGRPVVVWLAPKDPALTLPNTLLLAVYRPGFCNRAARAALEARGVIVSVGSACNAASAAPSGVVAAMAVPKELQDGVLRVSLLDDATPEDVKKFVVAFVGVVTSTDCLRAA
ncbi:MAG: aminotransferase class V-fold PLP-dependent enzyme [Patescibacteria group bacterium]|nr:aminotransferase class V-fold PLP-dependent enzyme [Patescibacteria group bacterium]